MSLIKKQVISRFVSLDVFRGITIALMILVNSPGHSESYSWLLHSTWDGCTLADLVFPFFLVMLGASCVLALSQLRNKEVSTAQLFKKIVSRTGYLFALGLLLNAFPTHFDWTSLRILGVLQRIALCYCCVACLYLVTSIRTQLVISAVILVGYCLLIVSEGNTLTTNLASSVDLWVFSADHLYTRDFDPEGLLTTLPAFVSTLMGSFLGHYLIAPRPAKQQCQWLVTIGFLLAVLGWSLSVVVPFNKSLWTSSYVLWTSGLAYLTFALCFALIEIKQYTYWAKPLYLFGRNALLIYVLHVAVLKIQAVILLYNAQGDLVNLRTYLTDIAFGHLSLKNASLSYALTYTLFWLLFLKYKDLPIYKKVGYSRPF